MGLTYDPSNVSPDGILVLRASNIGDEGLQFGSDIFVDMDIPEQLIVHPDDLLICVRNGSRHLIGKCVLLDDRAEGMTFGAFMAVFRSAHNRFVAYCFQSQFIKRQIREHLGATINQITNKSLKAFIIPFPHPFEQRAIAQALSDVDGLIEALDKLIAKKRAIKQAAMQQLLTGKTRLPGFSGEWETKRLGEVLKFQVGFPFSSEYFSNTGPGLRLVKNRDLKADDEIVYYNGPYAEDYLVTNGDVLVGMDGDFITCKWNRGKALLNQRVGRILASSDLDLTFAYYFLHNPLKQIERATSSTTVKHLSHGEVENITVWLPNASEQRAIATVLSDMDAEIEALERRREKVKQIKQGMMQQLLTGRIRLVKPSTETNRRDNKLTEEAV